MNENPESPRPTDHPEFTLAGFFFKEHLPLVERLKNLEDDVEFLRLLLDEEADSVAYLEMAVDELQDDRELSNLLHHESNARLSRVESRPVGGKPSGWSSSSHKPGGSADGKIL